MRKIRLLLMALLLLFICFPVLTHADKFEFDPDNRMANTLQLTTTEPKDFTINAIRWSLGILGILALIMVLIGGFTWMTAAGNEEKIGKAKKILNKSSPSKDQNEQHFRLNNSNYLASIRGLDVKKLSEYLILRKTRSKNILCTFWVVLCFALLFIILLGLNILDYSLYRCFPVIVITTFITIIIGIPIIIAKFPSKK